MTIREELTGNSERNIRSKNFESDIVAGVCGNSASDLSPRIPNVAAVEVNCVASLLSIIL